ncbi:uncharacterized protein LOC115634216 [Scaptodrosophila lebanonensis]|uniref:Uncharacterized protein LOC115634216 n=1 Tax=Drosophila lebanonensis TaxID=7225 RepID=A0A6J2UHQ4_DROLE|nr:uncharacterized protein LOC115634216 [Scaptodrosophila lebanonensis]
MYKLSLVLAAVLLCFVFATAQVVPNSEIGRVAVEVPLLSNEKPLTADDHVEMARVIEITPGKVVEEVVVPPTVEVPLVKESVLVRNIRAIVEDPKSGVSDPVDIPRVIENKKDKIVETVAQMPSTKDAWLSRDRRAVDEDVSLISKNVDNSRVAENKQDKIVETVAQVPSTKDAWLSRDRRAIMETTNKGIPNHGIPNPGIPNRGLPSPGIPNEGIPNAGIPNHGISNYGISNPGIPHNTGSRAASEVMPVAVLPPTTIPTPTIVPKRGPSKTCHQLLLAYMTTTPLPIMMESKPSENCDILCTKHDFVPICAHNGICTHEFANQCVLDTYNCKNRDLAFRVVDEDVCRLGLCARRCNDDDLKV